MNILTHWIYKSIKDTIEEDKKYWRDEYGKAINFSQLESEKLESNKFYMNNIYDVDFKAALALHKSKYRALGMETNNYFLKLKYWFIGNIIYPEINSEKACCSNIKSSVI